MIDRQQRLERQQRLTRDACALCADVERQIMERFGEVSPAQRGLLDNLRDVKLMRLEAAENVAEVGLRERYSNGRQTMERKNPSVDIMLRASATQAKIIVAMGLNKKQRGKSNGPEDPPEGGDLDDLDNY